jgi:hypothetical protein
MQKRMPTTAVNAKRPGTLIRVCRKSADAPVLECDWELVRIEPDSGNVVAERNGKRIVCLRGEFDKLNFPGSDEVWKLLASEPGDDDLRAAGQTWAKLDLEGVGAALIRHARNLDPVLQIEVKRAKQEYDRCGTATPFLCDQKDNLLSRWRHLEDQYAARKYRCEKLLPAWRRLIAALESLDAAVKRMKETSP